MKKVAGLLTALFVVSVSILALPASALAIPVLYAVDRGGIVYAVDRELSG